MYMKFGGGIEGSISHIPEIDINSRCRQGKGRYVAEIYPGTALLIEPEVGSAGYYINPVLCLRYCY